MKKVLIIDDDEDISYILDMVLSVNYQTMVVKDASKMVAVYAQFMPDLIIIDNFIGQRTAADVVGELKLAYRNYNTPYILFSAASNIVQLASDIEASAYLSKPFLLSNLLLVVETALKRESAS